MTNKPSERSWEKLLTTQTLITVGRWITLNSKWCFTKLGSWQTIRQWEYVHRHSLVKRSIHSPDEKRKQNKFPSAFCRKLSKLWTQTRVARLSLTNLWTFSCILDPRYKRQQPFLFLCFLFAHMWTNKKEVFSIPLSCFTFTFFFKGVATSGKVRRSRCGQIRNDQQAKPEASSGKRRNPVRVGNHWVCELRRQRRGWGNLSWRIYWSHDWWYWGAACYQDFGEKFSDSMRNLFRWTRILESQTLQWNVLSPL